MCIHESIFRDVLVQHFLALPPNTATVGAPSVQLDSIGPNEASIRLTSPLSPFDNEYVTEILTEKNIRYNIELLRVVDSQTNEKILVSKEELRSESSDNSLD